MPRLGAEPGGKASPQVPAPPSSAPCREPSPPTPRSRADIRQMGAEGEPKGPPRANSGRRLLRCSTTRSRGAGSATLCWVWGEGRAALPGNTWMRPHDCPGAARGHLDGGRGHTSARVHTRAGTHSRGVNTHTPPLLWSHHRVTRTRPHVRVYVPTDMVTGRSQHAPTYVCGDICTIKYRCRAHTHGPMASEPNTHLLAGANAPASHSLHVHSRVASNLPPYDQLSAGRGWPEALR